MNSIILQIASKHVRLLMLLFALLALLRGHNHPGGGFIAGLLAALGIVFNSFAYNAKKARKQLKIKPEAYIVFGLSMCLTSFIPGVIKTNSLMQGVWLKVAVPVFGELKLGTPFLFDIGVFFTITGVITLFFFSLMQKD